MANTKKTTAAAVKSEPKKKAAESVADVTETVAEGTETAADTEEQTPPTTEAPTLKNKKKLAPPDDSTRLLVRSNQYGLMGFINSRNGERTQWGGINDTQVMTVADLRDMKSNAARFLEETWIVVEQIMDPEYEDLSFEEIYDVLGISKYATTGRPRYMSDILTWDRFDIGSHVEAMSRNTKENVAVALNTEIQSGNLTNLLTIRTWEEALGMQLDMDLAPTGVR